MVAGGVHCYVDLSETVAKKACAANVFTQIAHFPPWIGATFPLLWWSSQPPTPLLAHRALYLVLSSKEETLGCCTLYRWSGNIWFIYWDISKFFNLCKDFKVNETQIYPTKHSIVLLLSLVLIVRSTFPMLRVKTIQREAAPTSLRVASLTCSSTCLNLRPAISPHKRSFSTTENHSWWKKIILNKRKSFWTKEDHSQQKKIILNKQKIILHQNHRSNHYRYPDRCHHYFQQTPLSHGSRTHCNLFPHLIQPTPQLAKQNSASHRLHFSM